MSFDVVALLSQAPSRRSLIDAMAQAGPDLRVRLVNEGTLVELRDDSGRLLAAMQAAQQLAVSAEADRLLDDDVSDGLPAQPLWVEARGAEVDDVDTAGLVRRFAQLLVERHEGVVWEPEPRLPRDDTFLRGATDHPAVSVVTDENAVVIQDRTLVPLSGWLVDALAVHGREGRGLHLVTPSTSHITHALRSVLTGPKATWVVRAPDDRYYDGFNGLPLVWDPKVGFVPDPGVDARQGPDKAFRGSGHELGSQIMVSLHTDHSADDGLRLGGAAELLAERLGGALPAMWGVSEPLNRVWNTTELTALARRRAPGRTWLAFSGPPESVREKGTRPFAGTQRVSRTPTGVRESILFAAGYGHDEEPELSALPGIVRELTSRGVLRTMTVHRLGGRRDLTYAPRWSGVPTPVGLAVGGGGGGVDGHRARPPRTGTRRAVRTADDALVLVSDRRRHRARRVGTLSRSDRPPETSGDRPGGPRPELSPRPGDHHAPGTGTESPGSQSRPKTRSTTRAAACPSSSGQNRSTKAR